MVSSEAKVSEAVTSGVYHFKIHDVFYHRSGPMTAAPCYDVDTAINYRLQEHVITTQCVKFLSNWNVVILMFGHSLQ